MPRGAAALVGLARPLIVEPDLPRELLEDPTKRATPVDLATGLKKLDLMIEATWYARQLERTSLGKEPSHRVSRFGSLFRSFFRNYNPIRLRRPKIRERPALGATSS